MPGPGPAAIPPGLAGALRQILGPGGVIDHPAERRTYECAAVVRLAPDYLGLDCVVPRRRLAEALGDIDRMAREAGVRVANVLHAGDGNLHPLLLYDAADEAEAARARLLAKRITEHCVDLGGSVTGEHGVGVDKRDSMPRMFSPADLAVMARVRTAFDPEARCNPGKVLPLLGSGGAPGSRV